MRVNAVLLAVLLVGCYVPSPRPGKAETLRKAVSAGEAESAQVTIALGVGRLSLSSGTDELLDARFEYNIPDWKPEVSYEVEDGLGRLTVEQPSRVIGATWPGNVRYDWALKLGARTPMDLEVELGVGKAELDLRGLPLRHLEVDAGVGEGLIDLSGDRTFDLEADIEAGIGKLTLLLSSVVGTRVEVDGGIGNVLNRGLRPDGDGYVNDTWGKSQRSLKINVGGGVGEVELKLVDNASI
jgi:hypothetical protein